MYAREEFVDHVYEIVEKELRDFDAIYEDYILNLVGFTGLNALKLARYVETCGVVNGRQLYTLCKPEGGVSHGRLEQI